MKRIWGILSVVFALAAALPGAELDALLATRGELFKMSGEAIMTNVSGVFQWMDGSKTRLRYNGVENKTPLTLFGIRVYEAIFDFTDGKASALNVSVYNRGDGGTVTKKAFESLLNTVQAKTVAFVGKDAKMASQDMNAGSGSRLRSRVWRSGTIDTVLRWSIGRDQAEFIALDFYPPGAAPQSLREGYRTTVGASELETRIRKDEDGSRYLTIPMVDQGAKGYCVAATVERVLRYYGSNIDQHVIAKLAESDSQRGTSIDKVVEALAGNQSKLGIKLKQLYRYDGLESYDDFRKLCKDYNTIARRAKTKKIEFDDFTYSAGKDRYLNYGLLMKSLDFNVFREIRAKDRRESKAFFEAVRENINDGVPLCWATFIFPAVEQSGSDFGMHMRLITGYNDKTGEIIYSDSWGAGHEKKVMKPEDAWGITVSLITLEPRRR